MSATKQTPSLRRQGSVFFNSLLIKNLHLGRWRFCQPNVKINNSVYS
jgi:hypothetical protein